MSNKKKIKKGKKEVRPEDRLMYTICDDILKPFYSKLRWRWDLSADMLLTEGQANKHERVQVKERGYPDFFLAKAMLPKYGGLYVELKKSKDEVYKKNGELRQNKHLKEQIAMHEKLREDGYKVEFCWDSKQFHEIIKSYLKGE